MRLKYYLRGLGLGIILTTVILTISFHTSSKAQLSDAEIIRKAELLGMEQKKDSLEDILTPSSEPIEEPTLTPTSEPTKKPTPTIEPTGEPAITPTPSVEPTPVPTKKPTPTAEPTKKPTVTPTPTVEPAKKPTSTEKVTPTPVVKRTDENQNNDSKSTDSKSDDTKTKVKYVTIEVKKGMGSESVAALLKSNGVIHKENDFNQYLIKNGLASKINCGVFKFPVDGDYDQLADILVN